MRNVFTHFNFFLDWSAIGVGRAESVCLHMQRLICVCMCVFICFYFAKIQPCAVSGLPSNNLFFNFIMIYMIEYT